MACWSASYLQVPLGITSDMLIAFIGTECLGCTPYGVRCRASDHQSNKCMPDVYSGPKSGPNNYLTFQVKDTPAAFTILYLPLSPAMYV